MTNYAEGSVQPLGPEEIKALLRAYAALALAQHAAEQYADYSTPDARLASLVKCQALAARELDGLLERAFSGLPEAFAPADAEGDCPSLLM